MKKLIIFDMDGTLFDTESVYRDSYTEIFKNHGFSFTPEEYNDDFAGQTEHANLLAVKERVNSIDLAQQIYDEAKEYRNNIFFNDGVNKKEGLDELLAFLDNRQIDTMVATSNDLEVAKIFLDQHKMTSQFIDIVAGNQISHSKPHPEIFLTALERTGVNAQEAFVVEDSKAGIEAGYRSGIQTIMVPDIVKPTEREREFAYKIVTNLSEIIELLHED